MCYVGSHIYLNSSFYNSGDGEDPPELCIFVQTVLLRGKENVHKLTITRNGYLGNHQPMSLFEAISNPHNISSWTWLRKLSGLICCLSEPSHEIASISESDVGCYVIIRMLLDYILNIWQELNHHTQRKFPPWGCLPKAWRNLRGYFRQTVVDTTVLYYNHRSVN
jgi:hypothetical protein